MADPFVDRGHAKQDRLKPGPHLCVAVEYGQRQRPKDEFVGERGSREIVDLLCKRGFGHPGIVPNAIRESMR